MRLHNASGGNDARLGSSAVKTVADFIALEREPNSKDHHVNESAVGVRLRHLLEGADISLKEALNGVDARRYAKAAATLHGETQLGRLLSLAKRVRSLSLSDSSTQKAVEWVRTQLKTLRKELVQKFTLEEKLSGGNDSDSLS